MKLAKGFSTKDLVPQAGVAGTGVSSDHAGHVRPPVVARHQFEGLPPPRVPCDERIVVLFNDPSAKILYVGNIDSAVEQKQIFTFEVPFRASNLSPLTIPAEIRCRLRNWFL